jgi:hypothetical protein
MLALVIPSEMISIANLVIIHTITLLTMLCPLTRLQMLRLQRKNLLMRSAPPPVQTLMTKKSIANLLLFLNPKLQCTLSRQQQALLLRATVIASALPSTTATMSLIARQVETKTKIPLLPSELSTQRFTHMLLSAFLMA